MKYIELETLADKIVRKVAVKFPAMSRNDFIKLMKLVRR